jgi:hypothetical protein
VLEEAAEALPRQRRLGDLSPAVLCPEDVVDLPIGAQRGGGEGKAELGEGGAQRGALGAIEIEERVVEVEEDRAEAGQGLLRADGGHFAR